jgi:hypothetical protein
MRVEANPQDGLFSYLSPKRRVPSDHPESHNCYFQGLGAKRLLAKHSLGSDRYPPAGGRTPGLEKSLAIDEAT